MPGNRRLKTIGAPGTFRSFHVAVSADGRWAASYESQRRIAVPDDLTAVLMEAPEAKGFFDALDSANRYAILYRLHHAKSPEARDFRAPDGDALTLVKPLKSIGGEAPAALLLSYPMARAMAPYSPMLAIIVLTGAGAIALLVRPQEAVAAVQALAQAYNDFYGAVADYDRAQFRLYHALGNPAQALACPPQP